MRSAQQHCNSRYLTDKNWLQVVDSTWCRRDCDAFNSHFPQGRGTYADGGKLDRRGWGIA